MSDSVRPHRRQPTRFPRPWDSPGKNTGVGCHVLLQCMKVKSESEPTQWCPTLCDPIDGSPPGSSIHGIFQARALEWGAIASRVYPSPNSGIREDRQRWGRSHQPQRPQLWWGEGGAVNLERHACQSESPQGARVEHTQEQAALVRLRSVTKPFLRNVNHSDP